MTREEIINEIKCLLSELDNGDDAVSYLTQNDVKWLKENIKALEQELTTKNGLTDDCISKEDVLQTLLDYDYANENALVIQDIKALPPVQPKIKMGYWIKQNDDYFDWYECSECGYGSDGEMEYSSKYDVRTNYCPHCGAKMESEDK